MAVAEFNIELQRNAVYKREWVLTDGADEPLDLTGTTFAFDVKHSAGDPDPPVASVNVVLVDAAAGLIRVELSGEDFDAVEGEQERVVLAFDCIATQDGTEMLIARGSLILLPGVS